MKAKGRPWKRNDFREGDYEGHPNRDWICEQGNWIRGTRAQIREIWVRDTGLRLINTEVTVDPPAKGHSDDLMQRDPSGES